MLWIFMKCIRNVYYEKRPCEGYIQFGWSGLIRQNNIEKFKDGGFFRIQ